MPIHTAENKAPKATKNEKKSHALEDMSGSYKSYRQT
jgi:hypothetical protein